MWKYFTANNTQKYIDVLPGMVELKPTNARKPANYKYINNALYAKGNVREATLHRFHVGVKVCIVRKKGTFEKGFTPNWK